MALENHDEIVFKHNQEKDRVTLRVLKNSGDFDGIDSIAKLTDAIGDHHFASDDETRLQREIRLLGLEDALDNFICRCTTLEHAEISETVEEARLGERSYKDMLLEQTDVLIRTLNLMTNLIRIGKKLERLERSVTIGSLIHDKTAFNIERPPSHGGKRF